MHRQATPEPLDQYLRDVAAHRLVTADEELALARRIQAGDDDALDALVRANLRFVISIAKKYQFQGVPLPDLVNEGNLGLLRAARRFDPTRGIRFISYAVWWIRQAILVALAEQSRIVRLPVNRVGALHRAGRRANALFQSLEREPTLAEVAAAVDVPAPELGALLAAAQGHRSLDAPVAPDDDARLMDRVADQATLRADDRALDRPLDALLDESLAALDARSALVLRRYYGLEGDAETLEQIGAQLGVTRERVRQIKDRALRRLSVGGHASALLAYRESID